jgi:hypothetical protein
VSHFQPTLCKIAPSPHPYSQFLYTALFFPLALPRFTNADLLCVYLFCC